MNHTQIKAFHAVARLGSFSKAAEALLLTQPAVSEQVRRLEQANDMLLFKRGRKGVQLTESGEQLFHFTKRYFEIEEEIDGCLSAWNSRLTGHLRLVADSAMHVADVLSRFRSRYPSVKVTIRSGNTETVLHELREYNAEVGVVGSLQTASDMESLGIGSSRIIAFAHKDLVGGIRGKLSIRDLQNYPLVLREPGSKTRQQVLSAARDVGMNLEPAFEVEGREAVRSIVLSQGGIGFVSRAEFSADERLEELEIADLDTRMPEAIVYLTQRKDMRLIRAFMGFARETISQAC
ncbi:MAG: LysR substrate-binding domain-containing protein [Marinibacterium sp.]